MPLPLVSELCAAAAIAKDSDRKAVYKKWRVIFSGRAKHLKGQKSSTSPAHWPDWQTSQTVSSAELQYVHFDTIRSDPLRFPAFPPWLSTSSLRRRIPDRCPPALPSRCA